MKKQRKSLISVMAAAGALSALLLLVASCERTATPALQQLGWEYYPLALGQYRVYSAYQINYNFAAENDTLEYELKEVVTDYFLNQERDTVYFLQRSHRFAPEGPWLPDSSYTVARTTRWVAQTVNNRPIVQLVFPVSESLTWNANLLNAAPADSFRIVSLAQPYQGEAAAYERSLKVVQEDVVDTIVETDQREEVYASGIGMVYKYMKNIKYCTTPECLGQGIISSGILLELQLKESGTEAL